MNAVNLICLKHQYYSGTTPPTLSCKTCCHIFVARLRDLAAKGRAGEDGREWLAQKAQKDTVAKSSGEPKPKKDFGYSMEGI
jgi:hypothetical protein